MATGTDLQYNIVIVDGVIIGAVSCPMIEQVEQTDSVVRYQVRTVFYPLNAWIPVERSKRWQSNTQQN